MESKENGSVQYSFMPDFMLKNLEEDLNNLSKELSAEEEQILEEILKLEEQGKGNSDLMKDLLEAAKKGTMQYLDAMTDTGETFDRMKDPDAVRRLNDEAIIRNNHSADPNEKRETRTMNEARYEVFDKNVTGSTSGMSPEGAKLFARHKEAYAQRTKSVTGISNKNHSVKYKSDESANFESLSSLRGYRVGEVVSMYSTDEIREKYEVEKAKRGTIDNPSNWLMEKNFKKFDDALMKEYGFKSRSAAIEWRKQNHRTIHEGPDGMYLVPSDVHGAAKHSGYRSKMSAVLTGKITQEDFNAYVTQEKIEYVKHEAEVRGVRAVKGVGLSAMKDVLKCSIVVICEETYTEFKTESKDKFIDRMLRIFKRSWEHVKAKCAHILNNIWSNIKGSLLSELLTAINDFFLGTFKNIFRIIRQMFGSIKSAWKIIMNKNVSWSERIFEASKILAAGIVGIIGFSLNELIKKGLMSIGIPFASFIAECLSGLFAGVMSAIVIMLFDKCKEHFKTRSVAVQKLQQRSRLVCVNCAQVQVSSLKLDLKVYETYNFIGQVFSSMQEIHNNIQKEYEKGRQQMILLTQEVDAQDERNQRLSEMSTRFINDKNF